MLSKLNLPVAVPRVLLGLLFLMSGVVGLFHLAPPPEHHGIAATFAGALEVTYLMTLVKLVEVTVAVLLLTNRFVPLALTLLAPISVNILGFHTLIEPGQPVVAVLIIALQAWLVWKHRAAFAPMFRASPALA